MGASSVTGTGHGDAGLTRGPNNNRGHFYSVVDPHVVWHGTATLTLDREEETYTATVYLPSTINVPPEHLAVFVGGKGYTVSKLTDSDGMMYGFVIVAWGTSYPDSKVDYIVIDANNDCFCSNYINVIEEPEN
jgi:hypothetical protein